jgi:hypothetical protein
MTRRLTCALAVLSVAFFAGGCAWTDLPTSPATTSTSTSTTTQPRTVYTVEQPGCCDGSHEVAS